MATLKLDSNEAIVLLDWIANSDLQSQIQESAVLNVIWKIEAQLEQTVEEVFSIDYDKVLEKAKSALRR